MDHDEEDKLLLAASHVYKIDCAAQHDKNEAIPFIHRHHIHFQNPLASVQIQFNKKPILANRVVGGLGLGTFQGATFWWLKCVNVQVCLTFLWLCYEQILEFGHLITSNASTLTGTPASGFLVSVCVGVGCVCVGGEGVCGRVYAVLFSKPVQFNDCCMMSS